MENKEELEKELKGIKELMDANNEKRGALFAEIDKLKEKINELYNSDAEVYDRRVELEKKLNAFDVIRHPEFEGRFIDISTYNGSIIGDVMLCVSCIEIKDNYYIKSIRIDHCAQTEIYVASNLFDDCKVDGYNKNYHNIRIVDFSTSELRQLKDAFATTFSFLMNHIDRRSNLKKLFDEDKWIQKCLQHENDNN